MKEKTSEQNASVEVPQMITSKTDLSIQKAYPWEMGNLDVEGGLHLTEDLGVNPVQTLCRAGVRFYPSASQDPLSPPGSSAWLCLTAGAPVLAS